MTRSTRLAAFSLFTLLAACSSTDSTQSTYNPDSGGTTAGNESTTSGTSGGPGPGGTTTSATVTSGSVSTTGQGPTTSTGSGGTNTTGTNFGGIDGTVTSSGGTGVVTGPVDCSGITAAGYELCSSSETTCEAVFTDGAGCDAVCAAAGLVCVSAAENADNACAADTSLPPVACSSGHSSDYCVCSGSGGGTTGNGGTGAEGTAAGGTGAGGTGAGGTGVGGSSTTGSTQDGDISIDDPVPGFASVAGGTSGGGTDIGAAITVNSMSQLSAAAGGSNPAIILVEPGDYNGTLAPGSNKTIIGTGPGVTINGNISISGDGTSNIIIRNLAVRGNRCNSYDECKAGADGVYVGNGAHHVWLDHLDVADGQDGNLDITQGGDYVTVSWTYFHYTYDKEHRYSNLIAGSDDEPASVGKLRITYMTSHWGERVDQRQPRGRFGNIHMLNNYHNTHGSAIHGVGKDMALIAENSVYDENQSIFKDMGSPRGWKGIGNEGSGSSLNDSRGSVFEIPYDYTAMPASEVVAAVTSADCGAGNTCTLAY